MRALICNTLFCLFGHHICCGRVPEWTAHVGQKWDTFEAAPWNLYNVVWRAQDWVRSGIGG